MTPSLIELLDAGQVAATTSLIKLKHQSLSPFYVLVLADGCDFSLPSYKDDWVTLVTAISRVREAVAVLFVSEAWVVILPRGADLDKGPSPSRHPDRQEVVAIVASDGTHTLHRTLKIVRGRRSKAITRLVRDDSGVITGSGGRMIDGIVPPSVVH